MIEARNLHCQFDEKMILKDFSTILSANSITSILGPNGAGKSTLLACLCGSLTPEHGEVYLEGKPIKAYTLAELAQKRAVLSQSTVINFPFTAKEIVLMGRNPFSFERNDKNDLEIAKQALH